MDTTVNPCNDFYKFTCGSFIKNSVIPKNETSISTFGVIRNQIYEQIKTLLEKENSTELRAFTVVKDLYYTCMNNSVINKEGVKPLLNILKKLGGSSMFDDSWDEKGFDWKESIYKLREIGLPHNLFIDLFIKIDYLNTSRIVIQIDQPWFSDEDIFITTNIKQMKNLSYYDKMIKFAEFLGVNRQVASTELYKIIQLQEALQHLTISDLNFNSSRYHITIKELSKKYTGIPWKEYINRLLPRNVHVDDDEIVIVHNEIYLENFVKILNKFPKDVLANYIMWTAAVKMLKYLPTNIAGQPKINTWKNCVGIVHYYFPLSVGSMYIRKYFKKDSKDKAMVMVEEIRKEFMNILRKVDWLDESTRQNALDKAAAIIPLIAYPEELLDDNKMNEYYKELDFNRNSLLQQILNLTRFNTNKIFGHLHRPVNKSDWTTHGKSAVVNAFYSPVQNTIEFPAGILQGVFFHKDRPRYMNYGAIGYVIGHEITHGFDNRGRKFDKDGNFARWWNRETDKIFTKKANCFVKQYGNYTVTEVYNEINGVQTEAENIADNGGIKEAYLAYLEYVKEHGEEQFLPGLNYNGKQMFWISAANTFCAKKTNAALLSQLQNDPHSPAEFRVLGPLSNMPEFSKDFNCPLGSNMNPEHKCQLW